MKMLVPVQQAVLCAQNGGCKNREIHGWKDLFLKTKALAGHSRRLWQSESWPILISKLQ